MPRKKKPDAELTTEEAMRRLFPRKVLEEAKREASQAPEKPAESKKKGNIEPEDR